jgi:hypothetical protein
MRKPDFCQEEKNIRVASDASPTDVGSRRLLRAVILFLNLINEEPIRTQLRYVISWFARDWDIIQAY